MYSRSKETMTLPLNIFLRLRCIITHSPKEQPKKNYNVIAIYAKHKKTGEKVMIGSLYQPYLNEQDLNTSYGRKSLSEHIVMS